MDKGSLNKNANFISSFGEAYSLCFYLRISYS
ncbi:Uncharacterised protein [Campylobacter coli]|nr:Uncharacterised protein [Campylobacter coli]